MVTPVAWTSFLTGCEPARHGIHEFFHLDADRRTFQGNTALQIKVDTVWRVLGAQGRSVVCINLPMTYPAPAEPGLFIGGNDAPGHEAAIASCQDFVSRLTAAHPGFTTRNLWKSRPRTPAEFERVLRRTQAQFAALAEAALLADAEHEARAKAIASGAVASTVTVTEREDVPLAYLKGNATRVRVKVVGEMGL